MNEYEVNRCSDSMSASDRHEHAFDCAQGDVTIMFGSDQNEICVLVLESKPGTTPCMDCERLTGELSLKTPHGLHSVRSASLSPAEIESRSSQQDGASPENSGSKFSFFEGNGKVERNRKK